MSSEISSPLLDIVKRAMTSPATGPASKVKERFVNAGQEVIALCDVSGSMSDLVGDSGVSKFHHMVAAIEDVAKGFPALIIVAFASRAAQSSVEEFQEHLRLMQPQAIGARWQPKPFDRLGGGTSMGSAISYVSQNWKPRKTILVTDGIPDSEQQALDAVEELTGSVDTIYCGPDADPAVDFLRSLSRSGAGRHVTWDGAVALAPVFRMLALPAPKGAIEL